MTLSILWSEVSIIFNYIGFIASILQLISLFYLFKILQEVYSTIKMEYTSKFLLKFALIAFALKTNNSSFSGFPCYCNKINGFKTLFYNWLSSFIYFRVFECVLLLILNKTGNFNIKHFISKIGIVIFVAGIVITELILFLQGFLYLQK